MDETPAPRRNLPPWAVASYSHHMAESTEDPFAERFASWDDWRGERLAGIRELINEAVPDVVEEIKWRKPSNQLGVPTWSHGGNLCTGEVYKDKLKLTFMKGASVDDPTGIFNASLDAGTRRAIDIREDDELDAEAFKALVEHAAELNAS